MFLMEFMLLMLLMWLMFLCLGVFKERRHLGKISKNSAQAEFPVHEIKVKC